MMLYIVSTEERMLDVVERLLVEHGAVIVSREDMFDALVVETDDPLTVSQMKVCLRSERLLKEHPMTNGKALNPAQVFLFALARPVPRCQSQGQM